MIVAEGEADKNRLETGNISFSDIENKADYKVKHDAINAGTSGVSGSRYRSSGNASSTTQSAVKQGELIINNGEAQKQDIKQLSRDTANAHHALGTIFDKEKQQTNIDKTELISEIAKQGQQVADKVGRAYTQHQIKQQGGPSQEDLEQARQQLPADASEQHIAEKAMDIAINRQSQTGMGSQVNKAIDAVSAIVSGIISGNITGGVAGALAPDIATLIKQHTGHRDPETGEWQTDPLSNTLAHALLGGVVAQLQGGNALAGATGAAVGENAANIISHILYPNKAAHELSPDEKEKVSGIASIAGAMAGSIAGGGEGIADAVTGGLASKNAVENNLLNKDPWLTERDKKEVSDRIEQIFINNHCGGVDDAACDLRRQEQVVDNLNKAGNLIADFAPILGDVKGFIEAEDTLDYAIATIGIIPGIGDAVGKVLKEAKTALKLGDTKKATELIERAQNQVKALDVGSYRELKAKAKVGDMLEHDHIPSFAALKANKEKELGRKLSDAEKKQLYNEATAVEVPKEVHRKGPTYGGKNTAEQVKKDAADLCGAVCRDTDALRRNMIEKGYDPKLVEDAINKIKARNKEMGIY